MAGRRRTLLILLLLLPLPVAWGIQHWQDDPPPVYKPIQPLEFETRGGMVLLPSGQFSMGSSDPHLVDARPAHEVFLESFWIDVAPVTNREFTRFVDETGFETSAEKNGKSLVFEQLTGSWIEVAGANWRYPQGPESSIAGKYDYPVVHVSWYDAVAYATWANKRLPTEAELEYASRGGLDDSAYPWGRELMPGGLYHANYWQGTFPSEDLSTDGFRGLGPVKQFYPNRFGLYDMVGNAWQWCADWYAEDYYGYSDRQNPQGPEQGNYRVRRGGSWLSLARTDSTLQVDHRGYAPPGESTDHTSFRCVRDPREKLVK